MHTGHKEEAKPEGKKNDRNTNGKHTQWKWEVKQFDCFKCCRQTRGEKKNVYIYVSVCVMLDKNKKTNTKNECPQKRAGERIVSSAVPPVS